jgi:transcriptional regulator with XRE-family HTH domain
METTLSERLVQLRHHFAGHRGQRAFARTVDIKQQSISNYERGSVPSANVLAKIVLATGVSAEWLLTGRGEMFPGGIVPESAGRNGDGLSLVDDTGREVDPTTMAELLETSETKAEKFLNELHRTPVGTERLPLVVANINGTPKVLRPKPLTDRDLEKRMKVSVTSTEVQVTVPQALLRNRTIRIAPDPTA